MKKKLALFLGALAFALSSFTFGAKAAPAQKQQGACPLCCAQQQCATQQCGCGK